MQPNSRVMVVRDARTKMHSLVRDVPVKSMNAPRGPVTAEQMNDLMMAKTPSALVESVEPLGAFFRYDTGDARTMTPSKLQDLVADGTLGEPDQKSLIEECVLDPFWKLGTKSLFEREGRNPASDTKRLCEERGPKRMSDIFGEMTTDGERRFMIEPLQDWVLLRNLVSIAMRFGGVLRLIANDGGSGDVLERSGMQEVTRTSLRAWLTDTDRHAYVTPLVYNPWFREGNLLVNDVRYPSELMHPFLDRITEAKSGKAGIGRMLCLKGSNLLILSAIAANVTKGFAANRKSIPEEGRWFYLVLDGDDHHALVRRYLRALDSLLGTHVVNYDGTSLEGVTVGYDWVPGAIWATVISHEGRYLMTCKQCGRTVLSTTQGAGREFCSDTCRATYNKLQKSAVG